MRRRNKILIVLGIVLVLIYGAAWIVARTVIADMLSEQQIAKLRQQGYEAALPEPTVFGFPGLTAGGASLTLDHRDTSIRIGQPRLSWRPWAPLTASIDGESFTVTRRAGGAQISLVSDKPIDIDIYYRLGSQYPTGFGLVGEGMTIGQAPPPPRGPAHVTLGRAAMDGSRSADREAMVVDLKDVVLPPGYEMWNLSHGHLDISFEPRLPQNGTRADLVAWGVGGGVMTLRETSLAFANGSMLSIEGTASWDAQGLVTGRFTLHAVRPADLLELIDGQIGIERRRKLMIQSTMTMLSAPGPDGQPTIDLPVTIEAGKLKYGSITLPGILIRAVN